MYCNNCGKAEQTGTFCSACGSALYEGNIKNSVEKYSMFSAYKDMLKRAFDFKGRTGRNEYWHAFLADFNLAVILSAIIVGVFWYIGSYTGVYISPWVFYTAVIAEVFVIFGWANMVFMIPLLFKAFLATDLFSTIATVFMSAFLSPLNFIKMIGVVIAIIAVLAAIAFLNIPRFSIIVRRLHDSGKNAWFSLFLLLPVIGADIMFILTLLDSESDENRWGDNPKGVKRMRKTSKEQPAIISAYGNLLYNYENLHDRTSKKDFWLAILGNAVLVAEIAFVCLRLRIFGYVPMLIGVLLLVGYVITTIIPFFTILVRRMHDVGKSGWIVLFGVIIPAGIELLNIFVISKSIGVEVGQIIGLTVATIIVAIILGVGIVNTFVLSLLDSMPQKNKWNSDVQE